MRCHHAFHRAVAQFYASHDVSVQEVFHLMSEGARGCLLLAELIGSGWQWQAAVVMAAAVAFCSAAANPVSYPTGCCAPDATDTGEQA
jgi:hypothetical protein